jgi:hypothetical protein
MAYLIVVAWGEGTSQMMSRKSTLALAGAAIGQAQKGRTVARYSLLVEGEQAREPRARQSEIE